MILQLDIISILPKDRSFTANSGTKAAILPKGRSSIANSGTYAAVLLGMNRCDSFPLLSVPHSFFSIWTNLERSEKIPGAPTRRWGEWIWLTGPSGLDRNSPQRLNISSIRVFDQIRDPEIPITYWKVQAYKLINELVPTEEKKFRHNLPSSPMYPTCNNIDTQRHRLLSCHNAVDFQNTSEHITRNDSNFTA